MSDDDDFMQESGDELDYEFESSEDDEANLDVENVYYAAKAYKETDPDLAVKEFLRVAQLEQQQGEKGEWGFKALKQAVKLEWKRERVQDAVTHWAQLMTYIKQAISRAYSETAITKMLDFFEKFEPSVRVVDEIHQIYKATISALEEIKSDRQLLKISINYSNILMQRAEYQEAADVIEKLYESNLMDGGADDASKSSYTLEIYAADIQLATKLGHMHRVKEIYERSLQVRFAVSHPKVLGVIHECGGKMHMADENWDEATKDFLEAFKHYDEAGSPHRMQLLKYVILTSMLMKTKIDPFSSQEARPLQGDSRIQPMRLLHQAWQKENLVGFQAILEENPDICNDEFMQTNMAEVLRSLWIRCIRTLLAPYSRIRLDVISTKLHISYEDTIDTISYLISTGTISGRINEQDGILVITNPDDELGAMAKREERILDAFMSVIDSHVEDLVGSHSHMVAETSDVRGDDDLDGMAAMDTEEEKTGEMGVDDFQLETTALQGYA